MAGPEVHLNRLGNVLESIGRSVAQLLESAGIAAAFFSQSAYWVVMGHRRRQPVRLESIVSEMMGTGIGAIPIVVVLCTTIGLMLALQGINALEQFGAQQQVTFGVALSVTREFAPLITGIVVAGRSGSALAARLGTMTISNEVDALLVMGVSPVRFLVVPPLCAMLIMVPCLALLGDVVALLGAGLYITADLDISMSAYFDQVMRALTINDLVQGLVKATLFGGLTALVGIVNGARVTGGAEGVGRVTTSAVVQSIAVIILTDMIFTFVTTR